MSLDREMEDICLIWKSAKGHLNSNREQERQHHIDKIRADGESFKLMKQQQQEQQQQADKNKEETKYALPPSFLQLHHEASPLMTCCMSVLFSQAY